MTAYVQHSLDRIAIGLAGLCAFHCLMTPLAVVLFPVLTTLLGSDDAFHFGLVVLVVPSSGLALGLGCRRHRDAVVLGSGALGVAALVVLGTWGHDLLGGVWERAAVAVASAVIALAHVRNYRLCRMTPATADVISRP
jgi:hypothetical protein